MRGGFAEAAPLVLNKQTLAMRANQNNGLPRAADLQQHQATVIYCEGFLTVFRMAKLERF